jgi:hypothetical protein
MYEMKSFDALFVENDCVVDSLAPATLSQTA